MFRTLADKLTDLYVVKSRPLFWKLEVLTDEQADRYDWKVKNYGVGSGRFFEFEGCSLASLQAYKPSPVID